MARVSAIGLILMAIAILWRAGLPAAPEFFIPNLEETPQYTTLQGETITLPTPAIINFWATWCIPCEEEMPILETLHREGLPVIGINAGLEDAETVKGWLAARDITLPVIMDDADRTLEGQYQVRGLPTTFFIDSEGKIQYIQRGALSEDTLRAGITAIQNKE